MITVAKSRTYYGLNLHAAGPAAYLCAHFDDPRSVDLSRLRRLTRQHLDDLTGVPDVVPKADLEKGAESGLPGLLATVVEWTCRAVGEASPRVRKIEASECGGSALIITCEDAETGRRAGLWAAKLLDVLLQTCAAGDEWIRHRQELAAELAILEQFATARRPSPTEAAITAAARERGIPIIRLDRWPLSDDAAPPSRERTGLRQLGWGARGRRLAGTLSDLVPSQTYEILRDRQFTYDRLVEAGIPAPYQNPEFRNLISARRAARNASIIGYPVVLKSRYRSASSTTATALTNEAAVIKAYERLTEDVRRQVIVERHIPGDTYRLLVIGTEVVSALHQMQPGEPGSTFALDGLSLELQAIAVHAAKCFALPIATANVVTTNPSEPPTENGWAVTGLDPKPDLAPFLVGDESIPLTAARRFLAQLFPDGNDGRIPLCAITGTNGKTTTSRMLAKVLRHAGYRVGLACTDGVYVDGKAMRQGTASGISGALSLFLDRTVECAVLETSRGTLVTRGLAFDRCDAAACTNIASDHLDEEGIATLEQMARLKQVVVESATRCAVLNADDVLCREMLPFVRAERTCLVSSRPSWDELDALQLRAGSAIMLRSGPDGQAITLRQPDRETTVVAVDEIPATWQGAAAHNVENAMFAAALALGLGVAPSVVGTALRDFSSSIEETPGRINVYENLPFKVVLDFAHNAHGMRALCEFVRKLDHNGRRHLVVYWTRNNPREPDLLDAMQTVAPVFNRFICRDSASTPEDVVGRLAARVEQALLQSGVPPEAVRVIPRFEEAIDAALRAAGPGDLVTIITGSKAPEVWRQVDAYRLSLDGRRDTGKSWTDRR